MTHISATGLLNTPTVIDPLAYQLKNARMLTGFRNIFKSENIWLKIVVLDLIVLILFKRVLPRIPG